MKWGPRETHAHTRTHAHAHTRTHAHIPLLPPPFFFFFFCPFRRELLPSSGDAFVRGRVSYASQEPWIVGTSVKENILFGTEEDQAKLNAVLNACALRADLAQLPNGIDSLIGERGVTLSGGQKARVSLARAVYRDADIYFLDDPLSAVDPKVLCFLLCVCVCVCVCLSASASASACLPICVGVPLVFPSFNSLRIHQCLA